VAVPSRSARGRTSTARGYSYESLPLSRSRSRRCTRWNCCVRKRFPPAASAQSSADWKTICLRLIWRRIRARDTSGRRDLAAATCKRFLESRPIFRARLGLGRMQNGRDRRPAVRIMCLRVLDSSESVGSGLRCGIAACSTPRRSRTQAISAALGRKSAGGPIESNAITSSDPTTYRDIRSRTMNIWHTTRERPVALLTAAGRTCAVGVALLEPPCSEQRLSLTHQSAVLGLDFSQIFDPRPLARDFGE